MKHYLFIILLLFGVSTAVSYGQTTKWYRVTGNNVNVRTGPGKNYKIEDDGNNCGRKLQLFKGQVVSGGEKKNGFMYVEFQGQYMYGGWVSAQFLTPAKVCAKCKGKGGFGKCKVCNGEGFRICCNYTGKNLCESCGGCGYK